MIQNLKAYAQFLKIQLETKGHFLVYVGCAIVIGAALSMRGCTPPHPVPAASPVLAHVNPEVKHADKVEVALETPKKTVTVYKASIKNKLLLPKDALDNPNIQVTDSSVIQAAEHPSAVTQVLDIKTGETTAYVSNAPQPWLAVEDRGQLSVDYGFKRGVFTPVARINIHEDVLQIKAVHFGVSASAYSDGDYFVGVGGTYRW